MKQLLMTTMFALAAAMDICPAGEEVYHPSFEWIGDTPAVLEDWSHTVIRTEDGAHVCRILVSVRAVEGKVPDAAKFSVQAEWKEKHTSRRVGREASQWAFQVSVKMDASRLRWQKENPDWSDGVECFEISFPIAIPKDRIVCSSGSLSVNLYYDGENITSHGAAMWVSDCSHD